MNKGELIDAIAPHQESAQKTSVTKKEAGTVLSVAVDTIVETIAAGEKIMLVGFGSFEKRDRKAREGRNPRTGETMGIPATTAPVALQI